MKQQSNGTDVKILVLSFYYEPDLSAGSFRTTALVKALANEIANGTDESSQIDVLSTLPNRYKSFTTDVPALEIGPKVSVHRFAIPRHSSGMIDQSKSFGHYALQVLRTVKNREYDLVFATSSRLMTATLGALIAWRKGIRLYLDIRDIFADTLKDVLPGPIAPLFQLIFSRLERWTIERAQHVNLVSPGFADYFHSKYPGQSFSFFTNGIDESFLQADLIDNFGNDPQEVLQYQKAQNPLSVVYAGNIGEGQGLDKIIPLLARDMRGRVRFQIIGDGGAKSALSRAISDLHISNIELRDPVPQKELMSIYQSADILFLHLNDYEAFQKVLPSKLFEYGAMGKPVWAGLAGTSAVFVRSEIENSAVFHPCNVAEAIRVFDQLRIEPVDPSAFRKKYRRTAISQAFARDILRGD